MSRLTDVFKPQKKVLNMYFTAGFPALTDTMPIARALVAAGADILEIGMPFSDPLADGPVIQRSSAAALANGMNLRVLFGQLQTLRQHLPTTPVLLMGYLNPVLQFGMEAFCRAAAEVGVDGLILPDLPLAEYQELYAETFARYGLRPVFLITPQTSETRIRQLDALSEAFLYLVSGPGTTGGTTPTDAGAQATYFERIAAMGLRNPRLIGFGIGSGAALAHAWQHAEGAIVGSALIQAITGADDAPAAAADFVLNLRQAAENQ